MIAPLVSKYYNQFKTYAGSLLAFHVLDVTIPAKSLDFSDMAGVHEAFVAMLNHQLCYFC
jgi:hypothetical protein